MEAIKDMNLSKVKLPENGKFGLPFTAFFSSVGVYLFTLGEIKNSIFVLSIASLSLILTLFVPRLLRLGRYHVALLTPSN